MRMKQINIWQLAKTGIGEEWIIEFHLRDPHDKAKYEDLAELAAKLDLRLNELLHEEAKCPPKSSAG